MKELIINWSDLKAKVTQRILTPQWIEADTTYYIFSGDGFILFTCILIKGTSDCDDFEDNFKDIWNQTIDIKTDTGMYRTYTSPRPEGMTTYFSGAGDSENGIATGNKLLFELTDQDVSKSTDYTFTEDIYLKDVLILCSDSTPFGAYIDVELVHPQDGVVAAFARKCFIYNGWQTPFDTEDSGLLPQGMILRVIVYNASNKVAFQVTGRIEMYRASTV